MFAKRDADRLGTEPTPLRLKETDNEFPKASASWWGDPDSEENRY